ncbi:hypothetical protein [Kangiella shandongensis]|uniref:hypothetical protein n=1 Tax=Kangiella shandongensis TaxID=2763258 RepID=UPI001CC050D6|nr:hypothetical protein [Kangiella shandongensis]
MTSLLLKSIAIWLVILVMAIVNAAIREKLLTPAIGSGLALPASGLILSVIIFLLAYITVPFFGSTESKTYIAVGIAWFALTLCFEFLFGHFIAGKPWLEIVEVFNVTKGNLFVVALLATLVAPWLSANARGLI